MANCIEVDLKQLNDNSEIIFNVSGIETSREENEDTIHSTSEDYANMDCVESKNNSTPFESLASLMTDVLPNGKVKKRITRDGYGEVPGETDVVTIGYNAYIEYEGFPFDSTYTKKKPFRFSMDDPGLLPGLFIGIKTMKVNEKSQFLVHSDLAYKNSGMSRVPPNSTILFEVEMKDIQLMDADEVNEEDKTSFSKVSQKCGGITFMARKEERYQNYQKAIKLYRKALNCLDQVILIDDFEQCLYDQLLMKLLSHLLGSYAKENEARKGCTIFNQMNALQKNGNAQISAKSYFYNAKCVELLGDYNRATTQMKMAVKLAPNEKYYQEQLNRLEIKE